MVLRVSAKTKIHAGGTSAAGIVVIGRNEGARLVGCLTAAKDQSSNVIYVDSCSSDGSAQRAASLGVVVVPLTGDRPLTAARGRFEGFERLIRDFPACRYVMFVDGDCILQPGWLDDAHRFLETRGDAAVVCGRRFEAFPAASLYNRLIDNEWDTPIGLADACGGDALMRVDALREVGSFRPELLAGEEPELCARLRNAGWEIWRIDRLMTEHDAGISRLSQWWRRAQRGGFGYAQVWSMTRRYGPAVYGRQIASAAFWVLLLPLAILVAATIVDRRLLVALPLVYLIQVMRIASRSGFTGGFLFRLKAAGLMMLSKPAELAGILKFFLGAGSRSVRDYRRAPAAPAERGPAR